MFTTEAQQMEIITKSIQNDKVKNLLFHMLINYEAYKTTAENLNNNMEQLNFYNFSKTQTCHINNGIWGEMKYTEYQFLYQIKVTSNLIVLITSAHRIITCIKQARAIEKKSDWKTIRKEIENCNKIYDNKLRNFMEHLEEKIYKQKLINSNCYFSPDRILYCKDEEKDRKFNFNNEQLRLIDDLISKIFIMLSNREENIVKKN